MSENSPAKSATAHEIAPGEDGLRLDRWFKRHFPNLTHGKLEKLLRTGQVRVDGQRAKAGDRVAPGQLVRVPPTVVEVAAKPAPAVPVSDTDRRFVRSLVLHEDEDLFILNKPSGLAVQGGTKTVRHLDALLAGLAKRGEERPRLVHRLDRDTSGVLVVARSAQAAAEASRIFRSRAAIKIYWALCEGVPSPREGAIDVALAKEGGPGKERMAPQEEAGEGQRAITEFTTVSTAGRKFAWLALRPITGRTHQIRAHLAAIGHPIVGDAKYGAAETAGEIAPGLHLHARAIILPRKGRKPLRVVAPLPPHMARTWRLFGFEESEAAGILEAP